MQSAPLKRIRIRNGRTRIILEGGRFQQLSISVAAAHHERKRPAEEPGVG
jgi:hypothetical protein